MKEVFADTFYFIALLSPTDSAHERAKQNTAGQQALLVTTAWVLTEVANALSRRETRAGFIKALDALRTNAGVAIIGHDDSLFEAGIELYRTRADKDWSLTDCISFVVMERRGITDSLTGDHHFEQAGFRALLK
jgi:predicted nucleic acid-binding protein